MMQTLTPNYGGKKYLEQCPKITIKELLHKVEKIYKTEILEIELGGLEIVETKANYGGFRSWFKCPICQGKVFILYDVNGDFKCRKCTGLKYKRQRYKGMIEAKIGN